MLRALRYLDSLADDLEKHELYGWIRSSRHEDPRRHLDCFVPILSFVITFPFYNMQYLAYPSRMEEPNGRWSGEADDGRPRLLRDLINEHAREDATHARLFLEDLRRLKLADVGDIDRASTLLWTLWVSPMLDAAQGVTSRRVGAIVDPEAEWPPYRYLHIEQLERDGHLLFSAAEDKAKEITSRAGATPVYFGAYHLERESGHVGSVELENVTLTGDQDAVADRTICTKHRLSLQM